MDDLYAQMVDEQSSKRKARDESGVEIEHHPPRRGYSREVEAIYDLTDNIVALRAEMGSWPRTQSAKMMSKRPLFPVEAAQERMRARARKRRDDAISKAQARWREQHERSGS